VGLVLVVRTFIRPIWALPEIIDFMQVVVVQDVNHSYFSKLVGIVCSIQRGLKTEHWGALQSILGNYSIAFVSCECFESGMTQTN